MYPKSAKGKEIKGKFTLKGGKEEGPRRRFRAARPLGSSILPALR